MIDKLTFLRQEWLWPAMLCAALLWTVFLWKEYGQSRLGHFILKAIVAFLAVGSLTALALQPLVSEERTKGVAAILTENYNQLQLDSLKAVHRDISVIPYSENGLEEAQLDSISSAYVLGNGMAAYDFWQLENIRTTYLGGNDIHGIVRLRYEQEPTLGDSLSLQGRYSKPSKGNQLLLQDAGGNGLDSIVVLDTKDLRFSLRTKPKVAGQYVYRLVEKDSLGEPVSSDPVPVIVHPNNGLSILIINTFPTFETKYLKNFLAENGHELLVRSQLTRNKYKFENFNRKQQAIYGLTQANLANFDLVIIDAASYLGLSSVSKQALERQMEEEGLGVFIQPDASVVNNGNRFGFRFKRNTLSETALSEWPKVKISVIPASFELGTLVQPIISSQNKIWSAYIQKGNGRLSTSMLNTTFQLVLDGNEDAYQYLWSATLNAVSQKELPLVQWETENYMAFLDEPFRFKLQTSIPNPEVVDGGNNQTALRQNLQLQDQWDGIVHPPQTGWNHFQLKADSTMTKYYYVGSGNDWQQLRAFAYKQENVRAFNGKERKQSTAPTFRPISLVWFFLVFVVAIGYLWVEPRINRG